MIQVAQVDEFVGDDGVEDRRGRHDESPVEAESTTRGAAAPAGVLVPHGEASHGAVGGVPESA